MSASTLALLIILGGALLLVLYGVTVFNGLVRLRNKVDESWSGIDVQLKRRHDLVPNLVETVKGYAAHERETLNAVVAARQSAVAANDPAAAAQAEGMLGQMLGRVFALAEAYPDLKANQNFLELQRQLAETEDELSAARRIFNGNVRLYNTRIQQVPANIVAGIAGFRARDYFELSDPSERDVVEVRFS